LEKQQDPQWLKERGRTYYKDRGKVAVEVVVFG
jgi:hypothetical protein